MNWLGELDLKTLHKIRKIAKLKKCSNLKKLQLAEKIRENFKNRAANKIQKCFYKFSILNKLPSKEYKTTTCPFTLEPPDWPFFVNVKNNKSVYYNLEPLIRYLETPESRDSHGNARCPVSRTPFTKNDIQEILNMARKNDLSISRVKNITNKEIEIKHLRYVLDNLVGEVTNVINFYDTGIATFAGLVRNIHQELVPTLVRNFQKLKELDQRESLNFINDTMTTINQEYENDMKDHFLYLFRTLKNPRPRQTPEDPR